MKDWLAHLGLDQEESNLFYYTTESLKQSVVD